MESSELVRVRQRVILYQEKEKKWNEPYIVVMCNEKIFTIEAENVSIQHFHIVSILPHKEVYTILLPSQNVISKPNMDLNRIVEFLIAEVRQCGDELLNSREVLEARRKEIRRLMSRGAFISFVRSKLLKDANNLSEIFEEAITILLLVTRCTSLRSLLVDTKIRRRSPSSIELPLLCRPKSEF